MVQKPQIEQNVPPNRSWGGSIALLISAGAAGKSLAFSTVIRIIRQTAPTSEPRHDSCSLYDKGGTVLAGSARLLLKGEGCAHGIQTVQNTQGRP